MVKTVVITLDKDKDLPDDALNAVATVSVNGTDYAGKVTGVITHAANSAVPETKTLRIKGSGLEVVEEP